MKKVLLYIHQLPQNILGLLVILFTGARKASDVAWVGKGRFGVSLGDYVIFGGSYDYKSLLHEQGHQKQSLYLGWLYLIAVGLPSITRNIWDRIVLGKIRKWDDTRRYYWYYSGYPEKWADKISGVTR